MKKMTALLRAGALLGVFAAFGASCASGPRVSRVDADTAIDLSGKWNDRDARLVSESLIASALASASISRYITQFEGTHGGEAPTVIVGAFRNETSEHIDTGIIAGMLRAAIINSGRLNFVEGGAARSQIRGERFDQQANASEDTAARVGEETGADLILQGVIGSAVDRAGGKTVRAYFVKASLTSIESNRILWEDQNNDIKKIIERQKVRF
ncbi:MAG: penicillin-binding protein activator LpoB [Treponema sp.]|jgi:hypothetical protein|nr:penicillin-binding protein activator LpoB [Treponema sp.]